MLDFTPQKVGFESSLLLSHLWGLKYQAERPIRNVLSCLGAECSRLPSFWFSGAWWVCSCSWALPCSLPSPHSCQTCCQELSPISDCATHVSHGHKLINLIRPQFPQTTTFSLFLSCLLIAWAWIWIPEWKVSWTKKAALYYPSLPFLLPSFRSLGRERIPLPLKIP